MEFEKYKPELAKDPPVQEMPVQSMITVPSAGDMLSVFHWAKNKDASIPLKVKVKGIAWGGGGSAVNRVDVSADAGENWTRAELLDRPVKQRRRSEWAWQFFEQEIEIGLEQREKLVAGHPVEIVVSSKCLNGAWNVQPADPYGHVNAHGCCVNHWYKVPVKLCPKSTCDLPSNCEHYANKPSGGKFKAPFRHLDQPRKFEHSEQKF